MSDFPHDDAGNPIGCKEDVVAARWAAMHQAADAIAKMLGKDGAGAERSMGLFPVSLPDAERAEITAGTEDLCVIMQQGLFAILRARENGAEAKVAARTLLDRFERQRRKLLSEYAAPEDLAA